MNMNQTRQTLRSQIQTSALMFGLALTLAACGGDDNGEDDPEFGNPEITTNNPAPLPNNGGGNNNNSGGGGGGPNPPRPPGPDQKQCREYGGIQVCRTSYKNLVNSSTIVPRLNPSNPTDPSADWTRINVRAGEMLDVQASGGWGRVRFEENWFGYTYRANCSQYNLEGRKGSRNRVYTNEGFIRGLIASDGMNIYELGSSAQHVFLDDGRLYIGFNAHRRNFCGWLRFTRFDIVECTDQSGQIVQCPPSI